MAHAIAVNNTKVTIDGETHICKKLTEVWELIGLADGTLTEAGEKAREELFRELAILGYVECTVNAVPVTLEIVPVEN